MHDLPFFRSHFDRISERLATRGNVQNLEEFRELDRERRVGITEREQLKARRNAATAEIQKLRSEGVDTAEQQKEVRLLGDEIASFGERQKAVDARFQELLAGVPNVPHESVPVGQSADQNVEIRHCGEPPRFDFEPKAHWDLGLELGILDLQRAAKITGARFALYWDMGAKLERALINFMLDVHTREHGYIEVLPPFLVNSASLFGTGQLPVRLYVLLPQRGWFLRARRSRHHPAAPVPEGGTGEVHAAATELRRIGEAHGGCGGHSPAAETALPHGGALYRRPGLLGGEDLRYRSLAARAERLQRDFFVLEFRGISGAPRGHPVPRREEGGIPPHVEWQRPGGRTNLGRDYRELSAEGWERGCAGGAAVLPECRSYQAAEVSAAASKQLFHNWSC